MIVFLISRIAAMLLLALGRWTVITSTLHDVLSKYRDDRHLANNISICFKEY